MRCVCSNLTPPTSFGILYNDPNEVGQSGTDRPASLLVTKAPAMIRRKVHEARITARRWWPRLYGAKIPFGGVPMVLRNRGRVDGALDVERQGRMLAHSALSN